MNSKIYTITSLHLNENLGERYIKDYRSRTVGFFFNLEEAQQHIVDDSADFDEGEYYNYIVIEELEAGIYPQINDHQDWWYKYCFELDIWQPCERPELLKDICGFSIG